MSHVSQPVVDGDSNAVTFPVIHSILSTEALCAEILTQYDLGDQAECQFLVRGVNDTYLVQSSHGQYILRVYRSGWRVVSDVLFEIDVLQHLERKGVPVSLPIARRDGGFAQTIQAPEGPRQLVLFSYAPGVPLDRHGATDSYKHGKALAKLHNATDDFASSHVRGALDLSSLIDQSLRVIQPVYCGSSADWSYLQDLAERLRFQVQQFVTQGLDWGVCHGDCHLLNEHISDDQTITFFDFDCCALGWRAYDLAIVRWSEGFYQMDPQDLLWQAFLKGYTECRPLSEIELASIPTFVALREIWHTALVATLQPDMGSQGFDKLLQRTLRLLRAWETTNAFALPG